jgi:hypothetical protein
VVLAERLGRYRGRKREREAERMVYDLAGPAAAKRFRRFAEAGPFALGEVSGHCRGSL